MGYSPPGHKELDMTKHSGQSFYTVKSQKRKKVKESEVARSCLTLSDPMDCSPPGSSVHGIFQARVLEWVTISLSKYAEYIM